MNLWQIWLFFARLNAPLGKNDFLKLFSVMTQRKLNQSLWNLECLIEWAIETCIPKLVERRDELVMTLNSQLRALESRYRAAVKSHIKGNFNSDQRRSMHWKWDSNGPYILQLYWYFSLICIRLKKSEKKVTLDMKGPSLVQKMLFIRCWWALYSQYSFSWYITKIITMKKTFTLI